MQSITLEIPENVDLPDDLDGESLLDALAMLRKIFGARKPVHSDTQLAWDSDLRKLGRQILKLEQQSVTMAAEIENLQQRQYLTGTILNTMKGTWESLSRNRPWIREETGWPKRYMNAGQWERRMLDACKAGKSLGALSTKGLKDALKEIIPEAVVQKEYNATKVDEFTKQYPAYVEWYCTQ